MEGLLFSVLAASTPGGPLDVILATGDPFVNALSGVTVLQGTTPVQLQLITDPLSGGYTTLASGQFRAQIAGVPEPSTSVMLLTGLVALVFRRRRVVA